ncbi:MAG TPA: phosphoribosylformylglycinamidine synthase subunit PurL, partial [Chitinophagaceae bacterium]|nr:phosphoribosylformylglycinamidine synthase subunit PurL [Chitinophagaceae bacterium]
SVGVMKTGKTISATSYGEGNPVYIVGSDTGKDGIGGASFASADINEDSAKDLPAVQVGDPFQEKKLLEACMELVNTDAIIGMQDMGAAGITCSTSEMSAKGEHGMIIHLDKVPTRQKNMKAWEMLLSESQERMLIVVKKGHEQEVQTIFDKWDIHCEQIGEVTKEPILKFYMNDELVASVPAESLVLGGGAPVYEREYREPSYFVNRDAFNPDTIQVPSDLKQVATELIQLPNIASKRWIYNQYDSMVGTGNSSTNAPSDAAVSWVKETQKGIASTVDCNSRYVHADPYKGGLIAVSEAARNIVCSGAIPAAITNCLNFGNPYNPEVYYQFVYALKGMSDACIKFDTPVTGGNVSFYNQSPEGAVYPTPTIGMVGVMENIEHRMTMDFKQAGDLIYVIGDMKEDLGSCEYLHKICNIELSPAPYFNLDEEHTVQQVVLKLIGLQLIQSAHDISEGGLFVNLIESAKQRSLGFSLTTSSSIRKDAFLFGEAQGRIVVSVAKAQQAAFEEALQGVAYSCLGAVEAAQVTIDQENWGAIVDWSLLYDTAIEKLMQGAI